MKLFNKKDKIEQFWDWFSDHSAELLEIKNGQEKVFVELAKIFQTFSKGAIFTFGPVVDDKKEFIVSAGGIKSVIPVVQEIISKAPEMKDWKIIAFRPKFKELSTITIGDKKIRPDQVYFKVVDIDNHQIDIKVYVKDFDVNDQNVLGCVFIIIDSAIGEYNTMTKLRQINFEPLPDRHQGLKIQNITELSDVINKL